MDTLPYNILDLIIYIGHLDIYDILNLRLTSKRYNEYILSQKGDVLFRKLLERDYPKNYAKKYQNNKTVKDNMYNIYVKSIEKCQWCKSILSEYGFCPTCEPEYYHDKTTATCCWCFVVVRVVEQADYEEQLCDYCEAFICDECMWGNNTAIEDKYGPDYIRRDEDSRWCPDCCRRIHECTQCINYLENYVGDHCPLFPHFKN